MMYEHLLKKDENSNKWLNSTSQKKKKKKKKKRKEKKEILVLNLPCTIEIASETCEVVASFTFLMFLFF